METTVQKKAHEATIYGNLYRVEVGTLIHPDEWTGPAKLQSAYWDEAEFYLPSYRYDNVVMAVNIKVTGRTFQRRPFSDRNWVRVQITFIGDGEESTFSPGWMSPDGGW